MDDTSEQYLERKNIRILRPREWEDLLSVMKPYQKHQAEGLLFTGMRYVEAQRLQENPQWWDGRSYIRLPLGASLKVYARQAQRTIKLSELGTKRLPLFFKEDAKLPTLRTWNENLRRWGEQAGLGPQSTNMISAKTTRKTWESWLTESYPNNLDMITTRQGHTNAISMHHYVGIGFYPQEKTGMQKYVAGWL